MSTPKSIESRRRQRAAAARYMAIKREGKLILAGVLIISLALLVGEVAGWVAEVITTVTGR